MIKMRALKHFLHRGKLVRAESEIDVNENRVEEYERNKLAEKVETTKATKKKRATKKEDEK